MYQCDLYSVLIILGACTQKVLDVYFRNFPCVCTGSKSWTPRVFSNYRYSVICARPPPLPQLTLTACFDLLPFGRPTYIIKSLNPVVSPHFSALARDFSGWLSLTAADSFPTLVFCVWRGLGERWKGFQCGCVHVSRQTGQTTTDVEDG